MTSEPPTWDEVLDDFEDLIEQVQHAIELDEWESREFPALGDGIPLGTPTAQQQIRLDQLLAEAASISDTVRRRQSRVQDALEQGRRTARAGRAYLGSTA